MTWNRSAARLSLGLVAALASVLAGGTPVAAAGGSATSAASATWKLLEHPPSICTEPVDGRWNIVYVSVQGRWAHEITVGADDLPAGSETTPTVPIPPGSDNGWVIETGFMLYVPPLPVGSYVARLWASDGTETQSVPLEIAAREDC